MERSARADTIASYGCRIRPSFGTRRKEVAAKVRHTLVQVERGRA